jgi:dienelactone hydrolase
MKAIAWVLSACAAVSGASSALVTRTVDYQDEKGTALEGYVVYDDATAPFAARNGVDGATNVRKASPGGKKPGVIVVHDWRGLTDYTKKRADMLAGLGYVAFAADIYGKGVHLTSVPEYSQAIGIYKGDRALYRLRERAAYEAFLRQPELDPTRIAAIGYCFGGTGVIEMVRDGLPLLGVVSFHGGLDAPPVTGGKTMTAKVLALCGADDPFEKDADMQAFEQQLRENNVDYQIVKYGHAVHAFTEADVNAMNIDGAKYNEDADRRSWQAMEDFLAEMFYARHGPFPTSKLFTK